MNTLLKDLSSIIDQLDLQQPDEEMQDQTNKRTPLLDNQSRLQELLDSLQLYERL